MPRHSPRPTAGRKRKTKPDASHQGPAVPVVVAVPADLTEKERLVWGALAPDAQAMGTLVPETATGFRLLVETVAMRADTRARLDAEGLTVVDSYGNMKAHPLTTHVRQLTQRVEALMAKFALVAPGRQVERPTPAPAAAPRRRGAAKVYAFFPPKQA